MSWCWRLRPGQVNPKRTPTEQDFTIQLSNNDAVPILRTCHLVYQEAAPMLYQTAAFHQSISTREHIDLPVANHFQWIRHLSIDFSDPSPRLMMFEELQKFDVDRVKADFLILSAKILVSLESLTLHIIATGAINNILLQSSHRSCKALEKLTRSSLQPRPNIWKNCAS